MRRLIVGNPMGIESPGSPPAILDFDKPEDFLARVREG